MPITTERYYKKVNWEDVPTAVMGDKGLDEEYDKFEQWCSEALNTIGFGPAIEVGSFWGRSTAIMAQFFEGVIAIDLWGTEDELGNTSEIKGYNDIGLAQWPTFIRNMTKHNLVDWDKNKEALRRVFPVCSTSYFLNLFKKPIDAVVCHIDAEHVYPAAYNDLKRCARHLTSGGFLILHDYKRVPGPNEETRWGWELDKKGDPICVGGDPWAGNAQSVDMFLSENGNFKIKEHFRGYLCMQKA